MRDVTSQNFGLLIAYLLPGFTILWGLSDLSTTLNAWLGSDPSASPSVGGFLYVTIASVAAGMTVSTLRWLLIDTLHHRTGIKQPEWDFSKLGKQIEVFHTFVDHQYRYYQFYGGMMLAIPFVLIIRWMSESFRTSEFLIAVAINLLFFFASRDSLSKYYARVTSAQR